MKYQRLFLLIFTVLASFATASVRAQSKAQASKTPTNVFANGANPQTNTNSTDTVANEIASLRKTLQALNSNLRDIAEKLLAPDTKHEGDTKERQVRVSTNLDLLTRVEQRAEVLRKQLLELIEKETAYRMRLTQLDEDMRPENIERALSTVGTTRTVELRDTRRRVLENERRGVENLLGITLQNRARLEDDVKQADLLVTRLRQRLLPLIDQEIEKIPEPK